FDMATSGRAGGRHGPAAIRQVSTNLAWEHNRFPWNFDMRERLICMPGDNLPAEPKAALVTESDGKAFPQPAGAALPVREAATQEEIKTETVADIVQPLPSFTETQADELIFPSLRRANLALRRAKSDVQKWERVCAALRELNKHRDIVRQITDSSRRVVSEK
ncbi:DUF1627 domain-containing protein, partial [Escherichia coli]|uniref:DUF1627 domain-containing protein n=1 Tax=Escherichia coli TaxID=562 RepID=UPI001F1B667C